jgi:hypothetical protein
VRRGTSKQELAAKLSDKTDGSKNLAVYLDGREKWIKHYNESATGRVSASDLGLLEFVQSSVSNGVEMAENLGVFWPGKVRIQRKSCIGGKPHLESQPKVWRSGACFVTRSCG